MARSDIRTGLALDEYARIMSIPGWLFNQVTHPERAQRGVCPKPWLQSGYWGDPNMIVQRDEIAQAIATAEYKVAAWLKYWPFDKWICDDKKRWPTPIRGPQYDLPTIDTEWGYVKEGGQEAYDLLVENALVTYEDNDGDGVTEWARVTAELPIGINDECELVVAPHGYDPRLYEIRPLKVELNPPGCGVYDNVNGVDFLCLYPGGVDLYSGDWHTGSFCVGVFEGWKWLFVNPEEWLKLDSIPLNDDVYFLCGATSTLPGVYGYGVVDEPGYPDTDFGTCVDIYRRYNDPSTQAQIVWNPDPSNRCASGPACAPACQDACLIIDDERVGLVRVRPSNYMGVSCTFSVADYYNSHYPNHVRMWYKSGYSSQLCDTCPGIGPRVAEAIVRLANCFLAEAPCGCQITMERWKKDREEMSIDSTDVELAQSAFGTTMRGAIFAYSVFKMLPPLG